MDKSLARFLRHQRFSNHTAKTLESYTDSIGRLIRFLTDQGHSLAIADLTADDVREWVDEQRSRGLSQATIRTRVVSVKTWTRWLVSEKWLQEDPLAALKPPKMDDKPKETLTLGDVEKLLASCDRGRATGARDFAIMLLLFSTGLRASEVMGLQVGDIDYGRGLLLIRRGKGGKYRQVPLGPKVERAIDKYLQHPKRAEGDYLFLNERGGQMTWDTLYLSLYRRGKRVGVHCNPHKWRHSAAIQYLRNDGRVEVLRSMLGHTTMTMTLHYARLAGVDLAKAHETADPARSLKIRV